MRKGYFLALLTLVVVAMVLPAGALAPIVNLPNLIVGGTEGAAGGNYLVYFPQAVALNGTAISDDVYLRNGFAASEMHAYYMSDKAFMKAINTAGLVAPVVAGDLVTLTSGTGLPAANKDVTGGAADYFWLSLINDGPNKVGAATTANISVATNGATDVEYASFVGAGNDAMVDLVVAETDTPTTYGIDTMVVYSALNLADGLSTGETIINNYPFTADSEGWTYDATYADASIGLTAPPVGGSWTGGTLWMHASPNNTTGIYYAKWRLGGGTDPEINVSQSTFTSGGSKVIHAALGLVATAANAQDCPGYRVLYSALGYAHQGGIMGQSLQSAYGNSINAPSAGNPMTLHLFWVPPFGLTQMGDTDLLATVNAPVDFRDYIMDFEMIDLEASDTGDFGLDSCVISLIAKPAGGTTLASYGTGGTAFNAALGSGGWQIDNTDQPLPGMTIGIGTATASATALTISAGPSTTGGLGYKKVSPYGDDTTLPVLASNQLVRSTISLSSNNTDNAPQWRLLVLPVRPADGSALAFTWVDAFVPSTTKPIWKATDGTAAGMPKTTGSVVDMYCYTHTAGTGADAGRLQPFMDLFNDGPIAYTGAGGAYTWPDATATFTMTSWVMTGVANPIP